MSKFRVVVTDQVFPSTDLERDLLAGIDATLEVASGSADEVIRVAHDADALLNTYLPIDADFISRLSRCKIIARYGIGVDNVDLEGAKAADIAVTNVPDYSVEEVAAHALALLLSLLRRLPEASGGVRDDEWNLDHVRPLRRLSTLRVGLVGYGRIARRLARSLRALDMDLVVFDPYLPRDARIAEEGVTFLDDLEQLLSTVDAVSLHCPLTPETTGLIGRDELRHLPDHAVLVNTSRGPLVDLDAVVDGLRAGILRGAALDVLPHEPPEDPAALKVPGLIVTPHMAYYSEEALQESQRKAATQVIKALTGEPLDYQVN